MPAVRKNYTAQEKAKIALDLLKGELTQSQITTKYSVHSTQLHAWKKKALAGMVTCFSDKNEKHAQDQNELIDELYKQIGQQKMELDWLKKKSKLFG